MAVCCPERFLKNGTIFRKIAEDLLPAPEADSRVVWISEVVLHNANQGKADLGRIDYVGVTLDSKDNITALVSVEFQGVHASGGTRAALQYLLTAHQNASPVVWSGMGTQYPTTDFLSSWKRIARQVLTKGAPLSQVLPPPVIKQALVVDAWFLSQILAKTATAPDEVPAAEADLGFYQCEFVPDAAGMRTLTLGRPIYTTFAGALSLTSQTPAGDTEGFIANVKSKVAAQSDGDW